MLGHRNARFTSTAAHKSSSPSSGYLDGELLVCTTTRQAADLSPPEPPGHLTLSAVEIQPLQRVWSVCGVCPQPRKYLSHGYPRNFNEHGWRAVNTAEPEERRGGERRHVAMLCCGFFNIKINHYRFPVVLYIVTVRCVQGCRKDICQSEDLCVCVFTIKTEVWSFPLVACTKNHNNYVIFTNYFLFLFTSDSGF